MPFRMSHIQREFTPSEAANITGVSTDLQRDWRRRKVLPENEGGKWTRFSLSDIVQMSVLKAFSDSGFSVSSVGDCAHMAILPTLALLNDMPGAVVFEGDEISDRLKALATASHVGGAHGRYLVMAKDPDASEPRTSRWDHLGGLDEYLAEHKAVHCTVLDCSLLARLIADRAGLPFVRVEVEKREDDQ